MTLRDKLINAIAPHTLDKRGAAIVADEIIKVLDQATVDGDDLAVKLDRTVDDLEQACKLVRELMDPSISASKMLRKRVAADLFLKRVQGC